MYIKKIILFLATILAVLSAQAQQKFSREQACADLDSMVYVLNEVHPNMFTVINMGEFMERVEKIKDALPDSLTKIGIYDRFAPLVSAIGDGHTILHLPTDELFQRETKQIPLAFAVNNNDSTVSVKQTTDARIPDGSKILRINGITTKEMMNWMLDYASGERSFYKLSIMDQMFPWFFQMRYASDSFTIRYEVKGKEKEITLPALTYEQMHEKLSQPKEENSDFRPYFYEVNKRDGYAILTFNACFDEKEMAALADSMVAELNSRGIKNLIIDVRNNSGGNSAVGDELLRRISHVPFLQYGGIYARLTSTTLKLADEDYPTGIYFQKLSDAEMIEPLPADQRFSGETFLLISHNTFSSASSFAWAFKYFGMGKVIGEETGGMNVHFGDILVYQLPHTQIYLQMSFKRFWLYGADEREIHGTLPDYEVPQGDALRFAIDLIKQ